jgi:hypothetical protein
MCNAKGGSPKVRVTHLTTVNYRFYNDAQSMRFRNLVLDETKSFFSKVALEDDEVIR